MRPFLLPLTLRATLVLVAATGGCGADRDAGAAAAAAPSSTPGQAQAGAETGAGAPERGEPTPTHRSAPPPELDVESEPSRLAALAGSYAARLVYQERQTLDVGFGLGGTLLNTITAYDLVTLEKDGTYVEQPCDVQIEAEDGDGRSQPFVSDVALDPALFARLPPLVRRFESDGERWALPLASQAIGWRAEAADPADEPLPSALDDPRLVDDDGDGNPGVTTTLRGNPVANGELYVAQLKRNQASGLVEGDLLVGELFDLGAQTVLGGTAPPAEQSLEPAGDASTNRIALVPVPASLDCEALLADAETLFPPHPVFD